MEVYTGYSGHSSDNVNHRAKRMGASRGRSEVVLPSVSHHRPQKNAIRVCGDWSEQLSSKGKIYFYNCITEVSQWQKPPEWKLPDMDHDELLRLLGSREQADGKNLKRPRVSASASTNSKEVCYETRISPKRSKFSNDMRPKSQTVTRKVSPSSMLDASNCISDNNRDTSQHSRANARPSPKRNPDDRRAYPAAPNRRHVSTNGPLRLHPTDDMDISPNSSPMSGCSGSSRSALNNQSPHFPKCNRTDYGRVHASRTVYDPMRTGSVEVYGGHPKHSEQPPTGSLRHLVDAIRASIGGLLSQSPSSSTRATKRESPSTTHIDHGTRSAYPGVRGDLVYPPDSRYPHSPHGSIERQKRDHGFWSPKSANNDSSSSFNLKAEENQACSRSDGPPLLLPDLQEQRRLDVQAKDVPGLVSTLTTLVSLIGSAKYHGLSSSQVQSIPTSVSLLSNSQIPLQRTPTSYHLSTPQRRYPTESPVMPSPLTPSTQTSTTCSGASCASTLAQSLLKSNLPPQQMDDLLSSLESFAQQARYRSSKPPTIEYYQPSRSQPRSDDRYDPVVVHTDYSDRSSDSPNVSTQNYHGILPHPNQLDGASSCSIRPSENRPLLNSPSESGHQRHFSDSLHDDPSCHTPAIPNCTQDLTSNRDTLHPPNATIPNSLPGSSFSASTSGINVQRDPILNPSGDHQSSSPDEQPSEDECLTKIARILSSPGIQSFVDLNCVSKFTDKAVERLEQEALVESRKFEKLQSVLYGELSAESKKLRALVRISEAKLAIHKEKQTSLQELMDAIETRKQLPNLSFSDDVI